VVSLAFLVGLAVVVGGIAIVTARGVRLWRQAKSTGRAFMSELERFDERAARTERLLAENEQSSRELEEALERLRLSRARLEVLRRALERSTARVRWLRAFLPV
jgi:predicted nuclease with TOPRIM domain